MKRSQQIGLWIVILAMTILTGACSSRQDNSTYHYIQKIYQEAHQAQDSANYSKALELYKECVAECSSDKYENDDSIKLMLPTSMVQLMNVYQSASMTQECIAYLDSLRKEVNWKDNPHRNRVLTETFKRDVYVLLAYATSRTDAEKEAALIMDTAMATPQAYPTPERKLRDYTYAAAVYYCPPISRQGAEVWQNGTGRSKAMPTEGYGTMASCHHGETIPKQGRARKVDLHVPRGI